MAEKDKIKSIELANKNIRIEVQEAASAQEKKIQGLQAKLHAAEIEKCLAVNKAKSNAEKERDSLSYKLNQITKTNEVSTRLAITETATKFQNTIKELSNRLDKAELEKQLQEITEAINAAQISDTTAVNFAAAAALAAASPVSPVAASLAAASLAAASLAVSPAAASPV